MDRDGERDGEGSTEIEGGSKRELETNTDRLGERDW